MQDAFHTKSFRPYTSGDVVGCEIGGCVKNVVAIAAGISEKALRRCLLARRADHPRARRDRASRFARANLLTRPGLSLVGDLVLTCRSDLSAQPDRRSRPRGGEDRRGDPEGLRAGRRGRPEREERPGSAKRLEVEMPITETRR